MRWNNSRRLATVALAVVVVVLVAVAGVIGLMSVLDDEEDRVPSARSSDGSSTTAPTSTVPAAVDARLWPDPGTSRRFMEPTNLARFYAVEELGFVDPILSAPVSSGADAVQIVIRAQSAGPVTTVSMSRFHPDPAWWIASASADTIDLVEPVAGASITSPVGLAGRASAFEGTIDVEVRDAHGQVLGDSFVTASGDETPGPFEDTVEFDVPTTTRGTLVLRSRSPSDGRTIAAAVRLVTFV